MREPTPAPSIRLSDMLELALPGWGFLLFFLIIFVSILRILFVGTSEGGDPSLTGETEPVIVLNTPA